MKAAAPGEAQRKQANLEKVNISDLQSGRAMGWVG